MKGFLYVYENQLHLLNLQTHLFLQWLLPEQFVFVVTEERMDVVSELLPGHGRSGRR